MPQVEVQRAFIRWQLAVGSFLYAERTMTAEAIRQAEQVMIDRYSEYLLAREQWEGEQP